MTQAKNLNRRRKGLKLNHALFEDRNPLGAAALAEEPEKA